MSNILQDSSPARLITAIEENLFAWIPIFGGLGQAHVNDPPGVKRSITDIPNGLFNSVMDARLAPDQVDETIQSIVLDARSWNVPVLWWTGPTTQPADLGKHLEKHGFTDSGENSGMAVDLAKLNESLPAPASLSIQLAQDEPSQRQWGYVMAQGFGATTPKEQNVNAWFEMLRHAHPETMLAYTGWMDNKPVATSLVLLAAGVAGMYSVATIPEARRIGIGARMTLHALCHARSMGFKIGIIIGTKMGQSMYRSLGYQEYCKIREYTWRPEQKVTAG